MIPTWRNRLVSASFRGFTFLTESHETKLGRRLVVHEFPGADNPLIEDLGVKAGELHVNAYFLGDQYDMARNQFLLLLQQPGSAWLVHPWLGRLEVRAKDWSLSESIDKNGYCTIGIEFVPAGVVVIQATIDAMDAANAQLIALAVTAKANFSIMGMGSALAGFIAAASAKLAVLDNIISVATLQLSYAQLVTRLIQGVQGDMTALLALPGQYVSAVEGIYDGIVSVYPTLNPPDTVRVVAQLSTAACMYPISPTLLATPVTPADALELLVNLEVDKAIHACFLISTAGQLALIAYQSSTQRDAVLTSVVTAIDALLPVLPDAVFQAAVSARVALIVALNSQDLDPLQQRQVFVAQPATVLAYRFELDEAAFNAMNGVQHPLFVSGLVDG